MPKIKNIAQGVVKLVKEAADVVQHNANERLSDNLERAKEKAGLAEPLVSPLSSPSSPSFFKTNEQLSRENGQTAYGTFSLDGAQSVAKELGYNNKGYN